MKASLMLWAPVELIKNSPEREVTGLTHTNLPVNAGLVQVIFSLTEWKIIATYPDGKITVELIKSAR